MKYYIFLLITYLCLVGCSKEPTSPQLEIANRLIQEQIDATYIKPNFNNAKDILSNNGETINQAEDRNEKLYSEIREDLIALKKQAYKDKKIWAVTLLEIELEGMKRTQISAETSDKELAILIKQREKWLFTLKE